MKKKSLLALLLLVPSLVFASNTHFIIDTVALHPDVVGGALPTYLKVGIGYNGFSLLENNTTDLQVIAGGGYTQRQLYQDPSTGKVDTLYKNVNVINGELTTNFVQGFLDNDSLTFNLGLTGSYEYRDIKLNSSVYPDLVDQKCLYGLFDTGLNINLMEDNMFTQDGFIGDLHFSYAPSFLNKIFSPSDFYNAQLDLQFAKTLFSLKSNSERNLFSVVLVNRLLVNYTDGAQIPSYFQKRVSLGNNVRGFSSFTYNTKLAIANNLDIRLSTFEITEVPVVKLLPRINFFFDSGYAMLEYLNSNYKEGNGELLLSTGVQTTLSISDYIDVGYEVAYLIKGINYKNKGSKLSTKVTFFLFF